MLGIMLMSNSSGIAAPSLNVEDIRLLDPDASLSSDKEAEVLDIPEDVNRFDASRAELYPDGVSTSAKLLKFGSPRTETIQKLI